MAAKIGISKKVPHAYIQDGVRYFALIRECRATTAAGRELSAFNFYLFDDEGYVWLQMTHTTRAFIDQLGGGLFRERWVLEVQDTPWNRFPIVESDAWIDGSPDRGYAIEGLREGLGINLEYLTTLMNEDVGAVASEAANAPK